MTDVGDELAFGHTGLVQLFVFLVEFFGSLPYFLLQGAVAFGEFLIGQAQLFFHIHEGGGKNADLVAGTDFDIVGSGEVSIGKLSRKAGQVDDRTQQF